MAVRARTTPGAIVAAAMMVVALSACVPSAEVDAVVAASPAASIDPSPGAEPVTLVSVVDGDTVETSAGTVRIIGIDTPERGECGDAQATAAIAALIAAGDAVTLELPDGQNEQDRHGRLLRYVTTAGGVDLALMQLQAGNAVARYDSADGYPAHPREADYHAAQIATLGADGAVVAAGCQAAAVAPDPIDQWWLQYSSCTKLKKNTVGHPTGPFDRDDPAQAEIYQWFAVGTGNNGDGEGDGLACE